MIANTHEANHRAQLAFHLTGSRIEGALRPIEALRPALFAAYSDLTRLRYDFPVVLPHDGADAPYVALSSLFDRVLDRIATVGHGRDRVQKILAKQEQTIRRLLADGTTGTLRQLWNLAAKGAEGSTAETLAKAQAALDCDGQVLDCDGSMPAPLFIRAWRYAEERKTQHARALLDRYTLRLSDILRADFAASGEALAPQQLAATMRGSFDDAFDFERMSALLEKALPAGGLSPARRARVESVLAVLRGQQFFRCESQTHAPDCEQYAFTYASCADVQDAYSARLPKMIELARALAIADLEVKNEYNEAQHDPLFAAFGAAGLSAEELALFPDYLLCLASPAARDYGEIMALFASNVLLKVLVQFDDLLEERLDGSLALSLRSKQLTDLAMGLGSVYVFQSSASNLVKMKERVLQGFRASGPALFSVYSGAQPESTLPPYLVAAAATESRAFPTLTYDPDAGAEWAARFDVQANPQPERDWTVQPFMYEGAQHERVACELGFTLADFMACDPRYAKHYARVRAEDCNGNMLTVHEWLTRPPASAAGKVPTLMMVDADNVLQRVVVDARAIEEAKRCGVVWYSLQELGGIHNSHAERLLAREKVAWQEQKEREIEALGREARPAGAASVAAPAPVVTDGGTAAVAAAPAAAPAPAAAAPAPAEEKSSDEAYIETPRCTTCEECVQINAKLFAYDGNKQAYISDLKAGTYRQLVEAAEACQVSIIHPGKPLDPNEAGLPELIERAAAFN